MALKGTTKIELTNVKTGEREVIEKDNLVTDAVPSILDNVFGWQLKNNPTNSTFSGNVLPLCPNLFGGILLYENTIPEEAGRLYAQTENPLIGYSSNNVNEKNDTMRGSMNQTESGELETHDGYRFVFDFATSQANGTIGSVCLTSKWGGMAGYGSTEWENTQSPVVIRESGDMSLDAGYAYLSAISYDADRDVMTSVYVSGQNNITVVRIRMNTKTWKLSSKMKLIDAAQILDTQIIETRTFAGASASGRDRFYNFCDGGDGYVWGFEHAGGAEGNSTGNASINWIKIKIDDLTFEEGNWSIDAQLYAMGNHTTDPSTRDTYKYCEASNSVIADGYLCCFDYNCTGIYKINLSNVTDAKFIEHPDKQVAVYSRNSSNSNVAYYHGVANLKLAGNKVCNWSGWINGDTFVKINGYAKHGANTSSELSDGWLKAVVSQGYPFCNSAGQYGVNIGAFLLMYDAEGYSTTAPVYANLLLISPYLATINNLPTPVQKTADKTMKITYILREES